MELKNTDMTTTNFDPKTYIATPSNWFSPTVEYEGWGRAEFIDPVGFIEGKTRIQYDELGNATIKMEVEKISSDEKLVFGLDQLLSGSKVTKVGTSLQMGIGSSSNPCGKFIVETSDGIFVASGQIFHSNFVGDPLCHNGRDNSRDGKLVKFYVAKAEYVKKQTSSGMTYWVIPLLNFISDFRQRDSVLDHHPLRIYPTPLVPEGLPEDQANAAFWNSQIRNRLIIFRFNNEPAFIEPLTDYDERKNKLLAGQERGTVTAIMVCNAGENPINLLSLDTTFPDEFLTLLSFASGSEIGASWVEQRDIQGELVRRIHYTFGQSQFSQGYIPINGSALGVGHLLTRAQSSPDIDKTYLRILLKHIVRGGLQNFSLEDRTDHLCRAVEILCEYHGLSTQKFLERLDESNRQLVQSVIKSASQTVRTAADSLKKTEKFELSRTLDRIVGRISNAANTDRDFGLATTDLLKLYGLPDADIVDRYYQDNPRPDHKNWAEVLSIYRTVAVHTGYFNFRGKEHDIEDTIRVTKHLHDILVRIAFKILGYDGSYQSTVVDYPVDRSVDWVKPNLPASELGYE